MQSTGSIALQEPEPNGKEAWSPGVEAWTLLETQRQRHNEASRRHYARKRAELLASRQPERPTWEDLAWQIVGAFGPEAREWLALAGLTLGIVRKAG
jgi:hypothetical protein